MYRGRHYTGRLGVPARGLALLAGGVVVLGTGLTVAVAAGGGDDAPQPDPVVAAAPAGDADAPASPRSRSASPSPAEPSPAGDAGTGSPGTGGDGTGGTAAGSDGTGNATSGDGPASTEVPTAAAPAPPPAATGPVPLAESHATPPALFSPATGAPGTGPLDLPGAVAVDGPGGLTPGQFSALGFAGAHAREWRAPGSRHLAVAYEFRDAAAASEFVALEGSVEQVRAGAQPLEVGGPPGTLAYALRIDGQPAQVALLSRDSRAWVLGLTGAAADDPSATVLRSLVAAQAAQPAA